jgi:hypothetical protein
MNPFTELVWEVIAGSPELLAQLAAIMKREYTPFLSGEKAFQANAGMLERRIREELDTWYEWLPDTPMNRIGGGLALEVLGSVDWDGVARLVQEKTLRKNRVLPTLPNPGGTA